MAGRGHYLSVLMDYLILLAIGIAVALFFSESASDPYLEEHDPEKNVEKND